MKEKYSHDALNKKLEELPVPDEEQSWQKMKALLDKDERKDRILPPFFLNCAGWALLILLTTMLFSEVLPCILCVKASLIGL